MRKLLLLLFFPMLMLGQNQPKVGLVLSGGGAKGFAHIGILKELEKSGVHLDYIGGTSMGSIVGGLYASGYSASQIEKIVLDTDFITLLQDKISRREKSLFNKEHGEKYAITLPIKGGSIGLPLGLSKGQNVLNYLTELLAPVDQINDFSKLPIPFYCIATNIETGEEEVLEKGSLPLALRASAAFPSLLNPVEIDGKLLVDGGVVNNFPVDVMRRKGLDLVIGVSVQGQLLKREELSSIASLLMQIVNFQMYKKSDEQTRLLNIYIRPDILEYSVISFDQKGEIIEKGIEKAKSYKVVFDSIAKLQTYKKKRPVLKFTNEKFLIDKVVIEGNKNYTNNHILGKMQLREGDSVSYKDISKKINTLTASKNFKRIDYHFEKSVKGKKLVLTVKEEKIQSYLRFGVHYDLLYKSAVLLNYNYKKLFLQNDELSLDVGIGDKIRYDFEYFVDNGLIPSYGFKSRYNNFTSDFLFNNNLINIRYRDFSNKIYLQTTMDKKFAIGVGIEHKNIKVSSENVLTNGQETIFDYSNYINGYSFLKLDTYNKAMFPTEGFYADIEFKWFVWSDRNSRLSRFAQGSDPFRQFSLIKGTLGFATTFYDKFTFQYISEAGLTLGKKSSQMFDFRLGGYNQNYINNFTPFYGYDTGMLNDQSFLRSEFNFRYQIFNNYKHYAVFIANYARVEENVFKGASLFDNTKSGYAVGYSAETLIGPIELKYTWSPDHKERYWLFNLGFWF
ncbi:MULTISPECIES: patatin-like phospholipase family protein [unclassified Tenacibaculum]|uniref:patatin-like phospholipase family protein n=1 Tax=unclassified Tenacibaculum TaxID=2635139 RepID=UPI001F44F1A2|nr:MULTISPECIES: patatin-like phospholipase family protein [unclassified Tenacibaculum]MCF2874712.1 patatin-like phospholipase family protein [Tenacibaculum sp. Cn5-1]MCF2934222.1 patatin-like phospholipase family protein [Tenacibaculum sp. Cn5-34]MCG7510432.1 patatin-like phospholipase family protein [Tenacibaculum sp. Cn5-46]